MRWKLFDFPAGATVSPGDLNPLFSKGSETPIAINLVNVKADTGDDEEAFRLLQAAGDYRGLTAVVLDGRVGGWAVGLAACADLTIVTSSTVLCLPVTGEKTAAYTAAKLSHQVGRAKAMELILDGEMEAAKLLEFGLVGKIVSKEEISKPMEILEDILSGVAMEAALRLKRVWRAQESADIDDALAVERIEFQRCFREGAAEKIAAFLADRKRT